MAEDSLKSLMGFAEEYTETVVCLNMVRTTVESAFEVVLSIVVGALYGAVDTVTLGPLLTALNGGKPLEGRDNVRNNLIEMTGNSFAFRIGELLGATAVSLLFAYFAGPMVGNVAICGAAGGSQVILAEEAVQLVIGGTTIMLSAAQYPNTPQGSGNKDNVGDGKGDSKPNYGDQLEVSDQKMYQQGQHYNKHGKDMGYGSKKDYEAGARNFIKNNKSTADIFEGKWNSGRGGQSGETQIIIRADGKQAIINKETGQIIDFYEGTSLDGFINVRQVQ